LSTSRINFALYNRYNSPTLTFFAPSFFESQITNHEAPPKNKDLLTLNRLDFRKYRLRPEQILCVEKFFLSKSVKKRAKSVENRHFPSFFIFACNPCDLMHLCTFFRKVLFTKCPISPQNPHSRCQKPTTIYIFPNFKDPIQNSFFYLF
jgi:hypothetical protein